MQSYNPDRRRFLKTVTTTAGASLLLGLNWSCSSGGDSGSTDDGDQFIPNAWLRISKDNSITVIVAESEMGQGPYTLMPMMVAEELEVDWEQIKVERASVDPVYGYQMTGGSASIRNGWPVLRPAGAVARDILLQAAAVKWSVPFDECRASEGRVLHDKSGRIATYGELIDLTASIELPEQVLLKEPVEFKVIGRAVPRKDAPAKVNGRAVYGIDIDLPGQLHATVVHSPVFGGKVVKVDADKALKIDGALDVFEIDEGVALVGKDTWATFKMAKAVNIEWASSAHGSVSTDSIEASMRTSTAEPTEVIGEFKDQGVYQQASQTITAEYHQPFQAHMTMEPMNCTAHFTQDGRLEIWAPTQSPSYAYDVARELTQSKLERGVKKIGHKLLGGYDDSVNVNTTLLGGGFGRRLRQDFVSEAVQIAERFEQPVKLTWSREEDLQHDFYHPSSFHQMKAALDQQGYPLAWEHAIKGDYINASGADHLYEIENRRISIHSIENPLPKGPWRSVAPHYNVFAIEHFLDELAMVHNHDPLDYRLALLGKSERLRDVLELAAQAIDWNGKTRGALSYGVAASFSFGSYVAEIVELEQLSDHAQRINKVVCAIDCGIVINPDIVRQQMEGSIIFGLSAATKSKIRVEKGRIAQSNFHDYPILRMDETPDIEVLIKQSSESPEGIGEPAVPPLAPALANAILAQTGIATRALPISL